MTKRKKIVWSLIAIAVLILLVLCAYMVSVPKLNIVYEVDEHTYYQSSRSIFRHEVQVNGYDQVSNVLLNDKELYATAQKDGHRYFLFHDEATDTTISVPDEDHAFSRIYASFMYNGRYTVEYEYADGEEETKRMLVSIDFENKERISIELPQQVLAGRIVSDGRRIFGSDKDYIYLLNEDKSVKRITRGSDVISVQDEVLYYVFNGKLCQYDLNAQTNSQVQNGPDLLEYDLMTRIHSTLYKTSILLGAGSAYLFIVIPTQFLPIQRSMICNMERSICLWVIWVGLPKIFRY